MELVNDNIEKAIIRSQHCQRNWDLSRDIPQEDLDLLLTSVTQCPSKQNVAHYNVHAITSRSLINKIHEHTRGFTTNFVPYRAETNSQVLANLLLVFEACEINVEKQKDAIRSDETRMLARGDDIDQRVEDLFQRDRHMAVGIAAGYANMTAALLNYSTGCCACFDPAPIQELLGLQGEALLLMGIGYKDPNLNRRVHHANHNFVFPTKAKQEIEVKWYK